MSHLILNPRARVVCKNTMQYTSLLDFLGVTGSLRNSICTTSLLNLLPTAPVIESTAWTQGARQGVCRHPDNIQLSCQSQATSSKEKGMKWEKKRKKHLSVILFFFPLSPTIKQLNASFSVEPLHSQWRHSDLWASGSRDRTAFSNYLGPLGPGRHHTEVWH